MVTEIGAIEVIELLGFCFGFMIAVGGFIFMWNKRELILRLFGLGGLAVGIIVIYLCAKGLEFI